MAITQTGAIYKAFSFDNVSSRTFGVYITSEAVYNAPERDVEMISIPGRNGAFALDNGRFENIEVKYPAGIFADTETDFAQAVSDLRNYLCSKKGYFRLTDEYNPNEYRLAVYKSGLEVSPVQAKAGEFEIIFDCKPQRFLTSGETEVTVASGGTLTNPTLFDSSPMIEIKGYGNLFINGEKISVQLLPYGWIQVSDGGLSRTASLAIPIQTEFANTNDTITVKSVSLHTEISTESMGQGDIVVGTITGSAPYGHSNSSHTALGKRVLFDYEIYDYNLKYGTATSTSIDDTYTLTIGGVSDSMRIKFILAYDGSNTITLTEQMTPPANAAEVATARSVKSDAVMLDSTQTQLNPAYIDLEMGEAYIVKNGEFASVNLSVTIPAKLPTLKAGSNTITFGNTFTSVKITPRWWRV